MSTFLYAIDGEGGMPGTVRPRRNVPVRMLHPSLPVYDGGDPSDDMVRFALSALIAHARRTGGPQLELAADVIEAKARKGGA